ncbi:MAG: hypothetical protein NVS1B10_03860 [Candidatus Saccharimonadales bacterium]
MNESFPQKSMHASLNNDYASLRSNPTELSTALNLDPYDIGLSGHQENVLFMASLGCTVDEAADILSQSVETISQAKDSLLIKFQARTMAEVVNKAMYVGLLSYEHSPPEPSQELNAEELQIAQMIGSGDNDSEIAEKFEVTKTYVRKKNKVMFDKLCHPDRPPTGRTHFIRRLYECGVFKPIQRNN